MTFSEKTRSLTQWLKLGFLLIMLAALIAGCGGRGTSQSTGGPQVWIDAPLNNDAFIEDIGTLVVYSHASADETVEAELYVNGELVRVDFATASSDELVKFEQPWDPPGPGLYLVEVHAKNQNGQTGPPATIQVQIGGAIVEEQPTVVTLHPQILSCPSPGPDTLLHVNQVEGFCFLYPDDYSDNLSNGETSITGPPMGGDNEGYTISFGVSSEDTQGLSSEQFAQAKIDQGKIPGDTPRTTSIDLDGETAIYTDELPSQAGFRGGYVVHNEVGFTLSLLPGGGQGSDWALAEDLWTTITTTWKWLDQGGTATPTPEVIAEVPEGTFNTNSNCRRGPGTLYDVVTSLSEGVTVALDGRNEFDPRWWYILIPNSSAHCWVSDSVIDVIGPVEDLPVIAAPLLPNDTPTETTIPATATPTNTPIPSPPAVPSNLTVSDTCTGSGLDVTLNWTDNANNENGFRVYRNESLRATLPANSTGYSESAPHTNSGYTYAVEAYNGAGDSAQDTANSSVCPVP